PSLAASQRILAAGGNRPVVAIGGERPTDHENVRKGPSRNADLEGTAVVTILSVVRVAENQFGRRVRNGDGRGGELIIAGISRIGGENRIGRSIRGGRGSGPRSTDAGPGDDPAGRQGRNGDTVEVFGPDEILAECIGG